MSKLSAPLAFVTACSIAVLGACSSSGSTPESPGSGGSAGTSGGTSGSGGAGDLLTPAERDTFNRGAPAVSSVQLVGELADSFFSFDPTVDPTKTAPQNA